MKRRHLFRGKIGGKAHWMDASTPKTLVGVNIAYPSERVLIEQQCFHSRAASAKFLGKLLYRHFQWVDAKGSERFFPIAVSEHRHAAKAANIAVAQLAAAVQTEKC